MLVAVNNFYQLKHSLERLIHHCGNGQWAGKDQRTEVVKDLEAAEAVREAIDKATEGSK